MVRIGSTLVSLRPAALQKRCRGQEPVKEVEDKRWWLPNLIFREDGKAPIPAIRASVAVALT